MATFSTFDDLRAAAGRHLGHSGWVAVGPEDVDRFRAATGAPAEGTVEAPLVPPFLLLSLSNLLVPQVLDVPAAASGVNYGTGTIRFPAAVPVGRRIRAGIALDAVDDVPGGVQTTVIVTVQAEGGTAPACVVESLSRWLA